MINETATLSVDELSRAQWRAFASGVHFQYWWGDDDAATRLAKLDQIFYFSGLVKRTGFGSFQARPLGAMIVGVPDEEYVAYRPGGGPVVLDLMPDAYDLRWYQPMDGRLREARVFSGGGAGATFSPPTAGEAWVMHLERRQPGASWFEEDFESIPVGAIDGWRRWARGGESPRVVIESGGRVLRIDPAPGRYQSIVHSVRVVEGGLHELTFATRSDGATNGGIAKIEVRKPEGGGWDKKFQVYVGTQIRVNYAPDGSSAVVLPPAEMNQGQWYKIRLVMDLDAGLLDVWVDGVERASNLPMHPGPLAEVTFFGWDLPGHVYFDGLHGVSAAPAPADTDDVP